MSLHPDRAVLRVTHEATLGLGRLTMPQPLPSAVQLGAERVARATPQEAEAAEYSRPISMREYQQLLLRLAQLEHRVIRLERPWWERLWYWLWGESW